MPQRFPGRRATRRAVVGLAAGALAIPLVASTADARSTGPSAPSVLKPRSVVVPATGSPDTKAGGAKLASFTSSFVSGGKTYKYTMVGTDPQLSGASTTVPAQIVPITFSFTNGTVAAGSIASTVANSALFKNAAFSSGNTQYGDAIQRAMFWDDVSSHGGTYHSLLGTPAIQPVLTINVPAAFGSVQTVSGGRKVGFVDINFFDPIIRSRSIGVPASTVPIFIAYNTVLYDGNPKNCCIGGYHSAAGPHTYMYSGILPAGLISAFDDLGALSHEVSEWYADPFINNKVPKWRSPLSPQYGCSNALETGDPLVGVLFTVGGLHFQDEAFLSWFARETPSRGINGRYTYLGTFAKSSPSC